MYGKAWKGKRKQYLHRVKLEPETRSPSTDNRGLWNVFTPAQTMCGGMPRAPAAQEAEAGQLEARVQKQPKETQSPE